MRARRILAATFAALLLGATFGSAAASAATKGPGLPPVGDKCAMQAWLGVQNVRACEDETS